MTIPPLPTRALTYLKDIVSDGAGGLRLVVLTGDAGHRRAPSLREAAQSRFSALIPGRRSRLMRLGLARPRRTERRPRPSSRQGSQVSFRSKRSVMLTRAIASQATLTMVCANRGRLRSALALERRRSLRSRAYLDRGLATGRLDVNPLHRTQPELPKRGVGG